MREIGHFIDGKAVKGASGRFGDVFDPNTGEIQARVALAKHSEVEHAIANAQAAQPSWAATNPQRRARVRRVLADEGIHDQGCGRDDHEPAGQRHGDERVDDRAAA